jgi:hypothetical protein
METVYRPMKRRSKTRRVDMRVLINEPGLVVLDDFLDESAMVSLWKGMNLIPYRSTIAQEWNKVWTVRDGAIFRGGQIELDGSGTLQKWDLDPRYDLDEIVPLFAGLFGAVGQLGRSVEQLAAVNRIALLPYMWPPKTSISWHSDGYDGKGRVGAFTLYVHKEWNVEWGGEFLLSRERGFGVESYSVFDNTDMNRTILREGVGLWIAPKPNRLNVLLDDSLHKVTKTTEDASPRLTIQGFLFGS